MELKNKPIQTTDRVISVSGRVFYNDRRRRIDVKKPIRDLFESEQKGIGYIMELCLSEDKLLERAKALSGRNVLPVLLYFTDEVVEDEEN
ncbi:MAG: hypothetical protein ACP5N2_03775 [Candidatus Nanoarchaeia archaeon]